MNRQLFGSFSSGDLSVLPRMAPKQLVAKPYALSSAGFLVMKGVVPLPPLQRQMTPMIREHTDWRSPHTGGVPPGCRVTHRISGSKNPGEAAEGGYEAGEALFLARFGVDV